MSKDIFADPQKRKSPFRGQPLIMLLLVLGSWTTMRVMVWETPISQAIGDFTQAVIVDRSSAKTPSTMTPDQPPVVVEEMQAGAIEGTTKQETSPGQDRIPRNPVPLDPAQTVPLPPSQTLVSHQLMWMAALAHLPVPDSVRAIMPSKPNRVPQNAGMTVIEAAPFMGKIAAQQENVDDNWSLDAWSFWRQGSNNIGRGFSNGGNNGATYGGSQAGAVLRYALRPQSEFEPNAYLRAYAALQSGDEQEVALGISARPVPAIGLRLHAEARVLRSGTSSGANSGRNSTRAAAFVTTQIAPVQLPRKFSAEVYGQAGYVTGAAKTAFADGQLRITREVANFDLAKINLGSGAYAGAQRGVSRADIGPTMLVHLKLGDVPTRVSVDWREKVAGNAKPDSGLAVTLSTNF